MPSCGPSRAPGASACEAYRELIVEALGRRRTAMAIRQDLVDDHTYSEAAVLLLRANPRAQALQARLVKRFGKAKALSVLAHRIGRAVLHMQKRQLPFHAERFYRQA